MSNWNVIIKEKQVRYKQNGIKEIFKKEDGAIDLASVMVGVIVIGVIGGIIATTIFAVIPWAQDNASKQQLDSIVQAENAYFGLSAASPSSLPSGTPANSFGKSAELKAANLLTDNKRYCVTTPDDKKSYTGYSQSGSGKVWTVTDKNSKATLFADSSDNIPADCKFITEGFDTKPAPVVPYVDPTPTKIIMTYQCDATTTVQTPVGSSMGAASGTYTWNDGATSTTSTSNVPKVLNGGTKYTFIFEGTADYISSSNGTSIIAGAKCIRSLDHWGTATNTRFADGAFKNATNLTNVPAHIPSTFLSTQSMFDGATAFNDSDVKNWDVSKVTNMSYMFSGATSFNQDLSGWNTGLATNMSYMFNGASAMNGGLDGWDTSKVTNMDHMFYGASSFNQPLNNWNTSNVTNMLFMFYGAPYSQDLTSWDMNKVNRMAFMLNDPDSNLLPRTGHPNMFRLTYQCDVTTTVQSPVGSSMGAASGTYTWNDGTTSISNIPKVLNGGTKYTFIFEGTADYINSSNATYFIAGAKCIRSLDHWGTATNTRFPDSAFKNAINLTSVPASVPSTFLSTQSMFDGATSFNDPDIKTWDTSKVSNMSYMFSGATSFNQDLSGWNTGLATNMSYMFNGASAMNGGLDGWDTSKVTNMDHMFYGASSFNQPLNNWNTSNVTNMLLMFYGAPYAQDLTSWDMNKVNKMAFMMNNPDSNLLPRTSHPNMFRLTYQCDVTTTVQTPVGSSMGAASGTYTWNDSTTGTSNVPKVLNGGTKYTFIFEGTADYMNSSNATYFIAGAKCIRSLDHWGTATNTRFPDSAFKNAINLTSVPASVPSTFLSTQSMFDGATSFNDPDIKTWDTSKVSNMSYMFSGATSFNQDLSGWNTGLATNMSYMFNGASAMNGGLDGWDTSKVTNMDHMFYGASSFNQPLNNWNTSNVTNMLLMFYGAPYAQDLTSWDMNKVNKMAFMMNNPDSNLLPRTSHPNMFRLTYQCDVTTTVQTPVGSSMGAASGTYTWNDSTTGTTNVPKVLNGGTKYTFIFEGTADYMNSSVGTYFIAGAKCIRSLDHWGTATNTRFPDSAFKNAINLTSVPASVPSTFLSTQSMFNGATAFNDSDVKNWDVSKVTNMSYMFAGATSFNQDLKSSWNTVAVTNGTFFAPASFPDAYMPAKTSK